MLATAITFTLPALGPTGAGCVRIPTCIENNIRCLFPGDGVFVMFNDGVVGNLNAAAVSGADGNEKSDVV